MSKKQLAQAEKTILKYAGISASTGLIPFLLTDVAILTVIQLKMLQKLSIIYELPFSKNIAQPIIASLLGGSIPLSMSSNLIRIIPIYGTIIGIVSRSSFSSASSYAIGKVFIQHFETGGTLLSFDAEKMKNYYQQQFKQDDLKSQQTFTGIKP